MKNLLLLFTLLVMSCAIKEPQPQLKNTTVIDPGQVSDDEDGGHIEPLVLPVYGSDEYWQLVIERNNRGNYNSEIKSNSDCCCKCCK